MATFFMFGKYSLEGMKGISAGRSTKAIALVKKHGGELKAGYALLGDVDLVLIVEMPDIGQAMKTSAALAKLLGPLSALHRQYLWMSLTCSWASDIQQQYHIN